MRPRAWWILALFAVTLIVFGLGDVANGVAADPGITIALSGLTPEEVLAREPIAYGLYDFASRSGGLVLAVLGVVLAAIVAKPYRDGQPWAWWLLWVFPAWAVLVPLTYLVHGTAANQPPAPPMVSGPIIAILAAAALVADRRRFRAA